MVETQDSKTKRRKVSCTTLKMQFLFKDKKITDIIGTVSKTGGCRCNFSALCALAALGISAGKIKEVKEALRGFSCPSFVIKRSKDPNVDIDSSCPDALCKAIDEEIE